MAIKKLKSVLGGQASGEYWKLVQVNHDAISLETHFIIALYKDKASADAKAPLLDQKSFIFPVTKAESAGDSKALGYQKIKSQGDPDLLGGEDV